MKNARTVSTATACFIAVASGAGQAAWINGTYWADEVVDWSGPVQNYAGTQMAADTTWWLTGPSDADVDDNGYAWDPTDNDYVAGWRSTAEASITVEFYEAVQDIPGDDLVIKEYSGSQALGNVLASSDGVNFMQIGTVGSGTPGYFTELYFDFSGLVDNVHYLKVERINKGPGTGAFFDSFAVVPEPASIGIFLLGFACLFRRRSA